MSLAQASAQFRLFERRTFFQRFGLVFSFLPLVIALSLLSDRFLTPTNLINGLHQATINGIISVDLTLMLLLCYS
jgi:ribose/xylose/arabinose/galactoside ABC-type transport system permease subunit